LNRAEKSNSGKSWQILKTGALMPPVSCFWPLPGQPWPCSPAFDRPAGGRARGEAWRGGFTLPGVMRLVLGLPGARRAVRLVSPSACTVAPCQRGATATGKRKLATGADGQNLEICLPAFGGWRLASRKRGKGECTMPADWRGLRQAATAGNQSGNGSGFDSSWAIFHATNCARFSGLFFR